MQSMIIPVVSRSAKPEVGTARNWTREIQIFCVTCTRSTDSCPVVYHGPSLEGDVVQSLRIRGGGALGQSAAVCRQVQPIGASAIVRRGQITRNMRAGVVRITVVLNRPQP
jgi:hypothetical protein